MNTMNKNYVTTIGLEIHAELKTRTKMFCGCANNPDQKEPNTNICPVCMGHPGTLPVINKEAVKHVLKTGTALRGQIADFSEFDRKNYFYPDIPKGYQISQYKYPLVSGGSLNAINVTRIHLEEDTGTLMHADAKTQINADKNSPSAPISDFNQRESASWVNYNRAGVPLMELVTEPVIGSAKEAADFARELQLVLRSLSVSDANMEKGEMRVEANISVAKEETEMFASADLRRLDAEERRKLGTKVEVKNLNSFRAVERAIEYEIERQTSVLEAGERVTQETRGWDESKQKTFSQRKKEQSHDYRYFPEPDLPKLNLQEISFADEKKLRAELPELPNKKRERYLKNFGIKKEDVEIYVADPTLGNFFEEVAQKLRGDKKLIALASNYITSDLVGILKAGASIEKLTSESFSSLIEMISKGELSSRGAKDTLAKLVTEGGDPKIVAAALGVIQVNDEAAIGNAVKKVIESNEKAVAEFKAGKLAALQFLIGQVMKETRGSASPDLAKDLLTKFLK